MLTTGTGSGKSLAYIVPIMDHVLRSGSGRGIRAIVVYPMNALANSQHEELGKFLCKGYPEGRAPVRFARYTGQERGAVREAIRDEPPDILLTNYTRPDFFYREANAAIYVDGPPHDAPDQAREDEARTRALIEAGYIVIRFHHGADWPAVFRRHPDIFGIVSE